MRMAIEEAFAAENLILASSGSHALQDWQKIIDRKSADISSTKHPFGLSIQTPRDLTQFNCSAKIAGLGMYFLLVALVPKNPIPVL